MFNEKRVTSELSNTNYDVEKSVETLQKWFEEYKNYLWAFENEILKAEGNEPSSLEDYKQSLYSKYLQQVSPEKQDSFDLWSTKFLFALSKNIQNLWQTLFLERPSLDEPRLRHSEWDKKRFLYAKQFPVDEYLLRLKEYDTTNPPPNIAYDFDFLRKNTETFIQWIKTSKPHSLLSIAKNYDFKSDFGVGILAYGKPTIPEQITGFLVHVTGHHGFHAIQESKTVGPLSGGRAVSFSENRFAWEGEKAILIPTEVLEQSHFPILSVHEAGKREEIREIITLPIPSEICIFVDTDDVPDKKPTNAALESATSYGENFLNDLHSRLIQK